MDLLCGYVTAKTTLTREDIGWTGDTFLRIIDAMELSARDLAIVQFVGYFKQLAATHVDEIIFITRASRTPCDRSLARLVRHDYLRRIGRRASGEQGGAGSYVYELGRVGWAEMGRPEGYRRTYRISNHALKVADIYVELLHAHREQRLELLNTWRIEWPVGEARADFYVELGLAGNQQLDLCLEVDLGTERSGVIRKKLETYWRAYEGWTGTTFPYVIFLVPDKYRKFEIERVIRGLHEGQELFSVHLLSEPVDKWLLTGVGT